MSLGQKLKARREELNMTQGELAKDLCTQAMISKIERDSLNPSSNTLRKLSEKLKVPVTYFYDNESVNPQLTELETVIRKHLNKAEYSNIDYLLNINHNIIENCSDRYFSTFFLWVNGVLKYYVQRDTAAALSTLNTALEFSEISRELKIDILTTLGTVNYENSNFENAESFFKIALSESNQETTYKKKVKILYNYSLTLESLDDYKKSLELVLRGIDILVSNQSLYMLGYLYFHKAFLLRNLKDFDSAKESYEEAAFVFKILSYDKMLTMTKIELKEMLENEKV